MREVGSAVCRWSFSLGFHRCQSVVNYRARHLYSNVDAKRCGVFGRSLKDIPALIHANRIHKIGGILPVIYQNSRMTTNGSKAMAEAQIGEGSNSKIEDREILVQHILLKEDQLQLLIELQEKVTHEGLDVSDLAEQHSICASKSEGGMLGWLKLGQTETAFEEVAFNAPLNKLVRAKTKYGLHLLQVLNERKSLLLQQLEVEEFRERMQEPGFLEHSQLIDVREPDEICTAAIEGFEPYPLSQFGKWAPNIAAELDAEKDTYVLCHHGMRSMQAANWLQSQGFKRLFNIAGGIHAYSKRVDATIPTY